MSRVERIRERLSAAAPMHTPGEWYHEDIPSLLSENTCLRAERDAAAKLLNWIDSEFGNYMPAVYHDKFVEWRGLEANEE